APRADVVRSGQADLELVEEVHVEHVGCCPSLVLGNERLVDRPGGAGRVILRGGAGAPRALSDQTSSSELGSRRDCSMPSPSAARKTSSSASRISMRVPSCD